MDNPSLALLHRKPYEKRLVIIDGNHLIHRAFYAIQAPLQTKSGEPTNAVFGFASMLLNILEIERPDFLVLTFDERAPTFRHDAHAEYKGTRVKAPDALYAQIPRIQEMVRAAAIPQFSLKGYEADDLMGTLANKAIKHGMTSFIVTGDMDALQLVDDDLIFVVFPHKGYREPMVYNEARVEQKYGVKPRQIVDYKALMGDVSDNIKGVEGIGPKRASELLQKFHDLQGIYDHLDQVPEGVRGKLEKGKEAAFFAQKLARIVTDVPCDFEPEKARVSGCDFNGLERFLEKMEIKTLAARLKKVIPEEWRAGKEQMSLF